MVTPFFELPTETTRSTTTGLISYNEYRIRVE